MESTGDDMDQCSFARLLLRTCSHACSTMQNLREAIAGYRTRLMHEGHEGKRNSLLEVRCP